MASFDNTDSDIYHSLRTDATGALLLQNSVTGKIVKAYDWHRTQLTGDLVVYDKSTKCIALIERLRDPHKGKLALPGGFADLNQGEDIDSAMKREAKEEINCDETNLKRVTFRANATRDERGYTATCVYLLCVESQNGYRAGDDAALLYWVPIDDITSLSEETSQYYHPLPNAPVKGFSFDHFDILQEVITSHLV